MTQPPSKSDGRATDRISEVEFEIDDQAYLFVELSEIAAGRIRLEEVLHHDDGRLIEFFSGQECPRDAIRAKAADRPAIDSARIVTEGEGAFSFGSPSQAPASYGPSRARARSPDRSSRTTAPAA